MSGGTRAHCTSTRKDRSTRSRSTMTTIGQHAAPHPLEDQHAVRMLLRTAEFSDDPEVLDDLARAEVTGGVLRKIAHNPATSEDTLERSEEHTSELQSRGHLVCRLLLEKKK